jgi:hypothetical protein
MPNALEARPEQLGVGLEMAFWPGVAKPALPPRADSAEVVGDLGPP